MTSDRESRGVFAVILAVAAVLIWVNLAVNPAGLPDWAGVVALILAAGAAGLWALSWRQSVAETAEEEPEPVVVTLGGTTPPAVALPVHVHVPDPVVEVVVGKVDAAASAIEPEPTPVLEAPPTPISEPEPAPTPVEEPPAQPTPISEPEPEPAPVEEPPTEPEAIGDAPVVETPTPVVETVAEDAPEEPAIEVQEDKVIAEATAAPETEPTPVLSTDDAPAATEQPEPTPVAPAVAEKSEPDDFTKIEGIGPYYRDALHKLGIHTFAELSQQTDAKALVERLKANGFRQHPAIPTWAEQAALAAAGDWAALEAMQAKLDGGRRTEG